jgi:phosphatidylglycerophosphate synthase
LREFLIATNVSLPVSKAGKIKTFLQMLAVVALAPGVKRPGLEAGYISASTVEVKSGAA